MTVSQTFNFPIKYSVVPNVVITYNYYSINCTYFLYPFKIFKITSSFYLEHCSFKNIKVFNITCSWTLSPGFHAAAF